MPVLKPKRFLVAAFVWQLGIPFALAAESPLGAGESLKGLAGTVEESVGSSKSIAAPADRNVSEPSEKTKETAQLPTRDTADPLLTGYKLMKSCSYAKAMEAFNRAARDNPASAEVHFGRAMALLGLGRREESLKEFKLAMLLDPSSRMAHKCKREIDYAGLEKIDHSNQPRNITTSDLERTTTEISNKAESEIRRIQSEALRRFELIRRADSRMPSAMRFGSEQNYPRSRYSGGSRSDYSTQSTFGGRAPVSNYVSGTTSGSRYSRYSRQSEGSTRARAITEEARLRSAAIRDAAVGLNSSMSNRPSESSGVYLTPHGTNLFVRNYVNFDPVRPEPPEELSARTLSLEGACCGATETRPHKPGCDYSQNKQRNIPTRNTNKSK